MVPNDKRFDERERKTNTKTPKKKRGSRNL